MSKKPPVHTGRRGDEWANLREGSDAVSKKEVPQAGRATSTRESTEHLIHNKDGKIGGRNSCGNDPQQPKGSTVSDSLASVAASAESSQAIPLCARCGHTESYLTRPYVPWRAARDEVRMLAGDPKSYKWWRVRPKPRMELLVPWWVMCFFVLHNIFIAPLRGKRSMCSWCHASLSPRKQERYTHDPFLRSHPQTFLEAVKRRRATGVRPNPTTAKWRFDGRVTVLAYLLARDGQRCGLCAMPVKGRKTEIDHVVPKRFWEFDLAGGGSRAVPGSSLRSRLHHVDNLQAAHPYCHKAKNDSPDVAYWRHPRLPSLPVAEMAETPEYVWISTPDD